MTYRLFIAWYPTAQTRRRLTLQQDTLSSVLASSNVRWVHPDNFHVTGFFLGNVESGEVRKLIELLDITHDKMIGPLLSDSIEWESQSLGLGAFPNPAEARAYVIKCTATDAVEEYRNELSKLLSECGFSHERESWHPHVTIGYSRNSQANLRDLNLFDYPSEPLSFLFPALLLRSDERDGQRFYTTLNEDLQSRVRKTAADTRRASPAN